MIELKSKTLFNILDRFSVADAEASEINENIINITKNLGDTILIKEEEVVDDITAVVVFIEASMAYNE